MAVGIAQVFVGLGSLIATVSDTSRFRYPGGAIFRAILSEVAVMFIGATVAWIGHVYVED